MKYINDTGEISNANAVFESTFFQNKSEAGEKTNSLFYVNGKGGFFPASHPMTSLLSSFTIPLKFFYGNTSRDKVKRKIFRSHNLFSSLLSLLGYSKMGWIGCIINNMSLALPLVTHFFGVSSHLSLFEGV